MYLANDVIQNSKKKGPEYGKEFSHVLAKVFAHIGEKCSADKLLGSLGRILNIWLERGVYDPKVIADWRSRLHREGSSSSNGGKSNGESNKAESKETKERGDHSRSEKSERREKRKHEDRHSKSKRQRHHHQSSSASSSNNAAAAAEEVVVVEQPENGHTPPYLPLGEPPEPEELIKALTSIENSASSDAVVRERIAKLPQEISEISCISKLEDKDKAKALALQVRRISFYQFTSSSFSPLQVNEAVDLLNDYNARLAAEMEERTKLATMLRDFQAEQKELLSQAEQRLDVRLACPKYGLVT